MRIAIDLIAGLVLASVSVVAVGQQLRDPTRPPTGVSTKSAGAQSGARSGMVLQTVLISEQRRAAVISGRVLSVGDTISGFRLAEIREGEVVMRGSRGKRTLRLYPAVSKVEAQPERIEGRE